MVYRLHEDYIYSKTGQRCKITYLPCMAKEATDPESDCTIGIYEDRKDKVGATRFSVTLGSLDPIDELNITRRSDLLEEARTRYPIGTTVVCLTRRKSEKIESDLAWFDGFIMTVKLPYTRVYSKCDNRWATVESPHVIKSFTAEETTREINFTKIQIELPDLITKPKYIYL